MKKRDHYEKQHGVVSRICRILFPAHKLYDCENYMAALQFSIAFIVKFKFISHNPLDQEHIEVRKLGLIQ